MIARTSRKNPKKKKSSSGKKKKKVPGATSKLLVLETTGISDVFFVSSSTSRIVAELRG